MTKRIVCLLTLLVLAACSGMKMQDPSLKPGAYHVSRVDIVTEPSFPAGKQANFAVYKPILERALFQQLANKGSGREVVLVVSIADLNLSISGAQALLTGGGPNVMSLLKLTDPITQQQLAERLIMSSISSSVGGVVGLVQDSLHRVGNDSIELADAHAKKIVETLYP